MEQTAFGVLSRLMKPNESYILVRANSTEADRTRASRETFCEQLAAVVAWATANDGAAAAVAQEGQRLVQRAYRMPQILAYMHGVLSRLAMHQPVGTVANFRTALRGASVAARSLASGSDACISSLTKRLFPRDLASLQLVEAQLRTECGVIDTWSEEALGAAGNASAQRGARGEE